MIVFLLTAMLLFPLASARAAKESEDITYLCSFKFSERVNMRKEIVSNKRVTHFWRPMTDDAYLDIALPVVGCAGIYVNWYELPKARKLLGSTDGENYFELTPSGAPLTFHEFLPCGENVTKLRLVTGGGAISQITVYGPGEVPRFIQRWEPTVEKAELMVIAAHPYDEHAYFGGTLPTYAGQQGRATVVVYMVHESRARQTEALNGLWAVGVRTLPVFWGYPEMRGTLLESVVNAWGGREEPLKDIVALIREHKPEVIVTHDRNGENGLGTHILTAELVLAAFDLAADPTYNPASAETYGIWQPKKLYLHMGEENPIEMDWHVPLAAFGEKTAFEMAKLGFAAHVSKQSGARRVEDRSPTRCTLFSLVKSTIGTEGEAEAKDFFKGIAARAPEPATPVPTPEPESTPEPDKASPSPSPKQTEVPTVSEDSKAADEPLESVAQNWILLVLLIIIFITAIIVVVTLDRRARAAAKRDGIDEWWLD